MADNSFSILLVEDNDDDIELAQRMFEKCGVAGEVRVCRDGAETMALLFGKPGQHESPPPHLRLILLDLNLPKVPGLDILRRVKSDPRTQGIRVVMLTGSERERDVLQSYNFGINGYIIKPIELERFRHIYDSYVREPQR
jgi:two-component system, response regulator